MTFRFLIVSALVKGKAACLEYHGNGPWTTWMGWLVVVFLAPYWSSTEQTLWWQVKWKFWSVITKLGILFSCVSCINESISLLIPKFTFFPLFSLNIHVELLYVQTQLFAISLKYVRQLYVKQFVEVAKTLNPPIFKKKNKHLYCNSEYKKIFTMDMAILKTFYSGNLQNINVKYAAHHLGSI